MAFATSDKGTMFRGSDGCPEPARAGEVQEEEWAVAAAALTQHTRTAWGHRDWSPAAVREVGSTAGRKGGARRGSL